MILPNIKKAYLEITNVCNLNCSFCPGTKRKKAFMSIEEFTAITEKLRGRIPYLYLHLMGEPTIHPALPQMLTVAEKFGFKVIITTNGTTLSEKGRILLSNGKLYKISISLHSFEANDPTAPKMSEYLDSCFDFVSEASEKGVICVLRLWNLDGEKTIGENSLNGEIMDRMRHYFGNDWAETRSGMRIKDKVFLEFSEKFEWPDPEDRGGEYGREDFFCYGLRDQIGILCDGTVVPCCLDSEGSLPLGNILKSTLDDILGSEGSAKFYNDISARRCPSSLCKSCGYATRFSIKK